jgi:hypothetical protein
MLGRDAAPISPSPFKGINPDAANAAQLFKNSRRFIFFSPLKESEVRQNSRCFDNTDFN